MGRGKFFDSRSSPTQISSAPQLKTDSVIRAQATTTCGKLKETITTRYKQFIRPIISYANTYCSSVLALARINSLKNNKHRETDVFPLKLHITKNDTLTRWLARYSLQKTHLCINTHFTHRCWPIRLNTVPQSQSPEADVEEFCKWRPPNSLKVKSALNGEHPS